MSGAAGGFCSPFSSTGVGMIREVWVVAGWCGLHPSGWAAHHTTLVHAAGMLTRQRCQAAALLLGRRSHPHP